DTSGNESSKSATASATTGKTPAGSYRADQCPTATVTVKNATDLMRAVAAAKPGDVIRMAPGTYHGQLNLKANGTASKPIWLCGPRDAVVNGGGYAKNSPINVSASSHFILTGMTVTNGLKGVTVRSSNNVTISDMLVHNIGYEAVHLLVNTTDSVVVGNTIRKTGQRDAFYGEGVYIGSSDNNWCNLTACKPDRSDRNAVIGNNISATGSDLIEAKEGTSGGVIRGNTLNGEGSMKRTESWVMVSGNGWSVLQNSAKQSSLHGYRVNGASDGWGFGTVFAGNKSVVDAAGYGFKLHEPKGAGTSGTLVSCTNIVSGAALGFSNAGCSK
ncbi:MAG: Right handed beta helix region, partial [Cryobacterium sp.]|nr:Right handed beta helix region [Cryobacterium sp.]